MRELEADNFAKNLSDAEERTFEESDLKRKESFVGKEHLKIFQTSKVLQVDNEATNLIDVDERKFGEYNLKLKSQCKGKFQTRKYLKHFVN